MPPITPDHHTCVGLAMELRAKLVDCPWGELLYLVSCEESIGNFDEYPGLYDVIEDAGAILEKEHVLLALKFQVLGRRGLILCDPGYHVGRVIVIMQDQEYPHTGWFTQSNDGNVRKEYSYQFSAANASFVEWRERIWRNGVKSDQETHSLIYIERPYLTAIDVTERRNLVYSFRSLLSRDQKGHLLAGIYFKVKENYDEFTLIYQDDCKAQRLKFNFAEVADMERVKGDARLLRILEKCSEQLNYDDCDDFLAVLQSLNEVLQDKAFVRQVLDINNCINDMTEVY